MSVNAGERSSSKTLSAVLWDVGGPINTEVKHEKSIDAAIRNAFQGEGQAIDDSAYLDAWQFAVNSFAPDAYKAVIWWLSDFDPVASLRIHREVTRTAPYPGTFQLREGIDTLFGKLHGAGVKLGLVANQPESTLATLDAIGICSYFGHFKVSGQTGFRKPDPRLFLEACEGLDVSPKACVMVGDRIDNDVVPANSLGMTTILLRTGRHREQKPRSWEEVPHETVTSVHELATTLNRLLSY